MNQEILNRLKALGPILYLLLAFIAVLSLFTLYLGAGNEIDERHKPFDEIPFDYATGDFPAYIEYSRSLLQEARITAASETQLDDLSPFIFQPSDSCALTEQGKYKRAIVVTHGLVASSYSMRSIGEYYQQQCFLVVGLLLPDHGTRPGDMLSSHWQKWTAAHHFATKYAESVADEVWLSGHSVGGTLAIYEAAVNDKVDGMVLFAPALEINAASRFAGTISFLGAWHAPAAWFEIEPDTALYRYESFPYYAGAQTWDLIKATWAALEEREKNLDMPIFMVASVEDMTVTTDALLTFMAEQNEDSHTLLYSQYSLTNTDNAELVEDENITVTLSGLPETNILSVSHLGLMTPPDHPFYGEQGEYHYCEYFYQNNRPAFDVCMRGDSDFLGETTEENMQHMVFERIAYNPHYYTMLDQLSAFFQ